MSASNTRLLIIGLFLSALVFHLTVVAQDFSVLAKNGFLYDDSFYAFKISQNIARGDGISFDGVHQTNGFQPLYVFLLVPFFYFAGSNLTAPIYAALAFSALLTALTAVLLYLIVRRYVSCKIAVLTAAIWAFSPVVTRQSANGLETSLALLLFASVVYLYLSRIRPVERPRTRHFILLGVLLGLAVLARIDEIFLALVILLDYLLVLRRRRAMAGALGKVGVVVICALVVYGPWMLYGVATTGHLFQDSGSATRYLSMAYAPLFDLGSSDMVASGPSAGFVWGHVVHSFSVLKIAPPTHAFFRAIEKFGVAVGAPHLAVVLADVLGLALVAAFVYLVVLRRRALKVTGFEEVQFLLLYVVVVIAAYSLYVFGVFFFARYYYPLYFVICLYAGLLIEEVFRKFSARAVVGRSLAAVILVGYLGVFGYMAYACVCRSNSVYCFYDVAKWVEANTLPDDTIGVFQSGAIGYLSDRKVINLDGKVNRDALEALKDKRLDEYLRKEGVDVVIDNANVLDLFLTPSFGNPPSKDDLTTLGLDQIMHGASDGVPGWAAYRVNGFAESSGGGGSSTLPESHHRR
ncbi:MAG: glycosyltransferase family 39 protein [Candidatus Latescibacterota bacterium]|nr:MAG: glycosyltransferase family 39 protein [Candidatus Latescibacterota bacterium]